MNVFISVSNFYMKVHKSRLSKNKNVVVVIIVVVVAVVAMTGTIS